MKLTLIDNWKNIWKWYSTHAMVIYTALVSYYAQMPAEDKASLPLWVIYLIQAVIVVSFVVGRLIKQEQTNE